MTDTISQTLRRLVRKRAHARCEYCLMPADEMLFPHEPDHIISLKHRGETTPENLAYACIDCNRAKGSDIASLDPATGMLTSLFNPRQQQWVDHFRFNGPLIEPLTAEGRVTVLLLKINIPERIAMRYNLILEERYSLPTE